MDCNRQKQQSAPGEKEKNNLYFRDLAGDVRVVSEEKRQVELSFSSEYPYERYYGTEILCHDDGCIDLSRLQETGALLYHHGRDQNIGSIPIGKIVSVAVDPGERRGRATVEFDEDPNSELIFQKVNSGTIRGVSVGYIIGAYEEVKSGATSSNGRFNGPCVVATKWTPYEISIEPTPADATVGVGRNITPKGEENVMNENEKAMNQTAERQQKAAGAPPAVERPKEGTREAVEAERRRVSEITALCRDFEIDPMDYIGSEKSISEVRAEVLEKLKTKNQKPVPAARAEVVADEEDRYRAAARDGLLLRMGFVVSKPADGAKEFRGLSLRSLAQGCAMRAGVEDAVRLDDERLLRAALGFDETRGVLEPHSAFVSVLNNTMSAVVSQGYTETPTTFDQWTGKGSNPNFKASKRYRLSAAGEVVEVKENGEFKADSVSDEGIDTALKTFGKKFGFSRRTFIDDDLGTVARAVLAQTRSCKRTINRKVYEILGKNPKYIDGKALFVADHANLGTAAALSTASLGALYKMMMQQKDIGGKATLNITPRYLLVPVALTLEAAQLIYSDSDPSAAHSGVKNPLLGKFEIITDAELDQYSSTGFYVAASPMDVDTIEVTYLNGKEEPTLENRVSWDKLGIEYRMYHDFNVTLLDYRGLAHNAGK